MKRSCFTIVICKWYVHFDLRKEFCFVILGTENQSIVLNEIYVTKSVK